MHNFLEPTPWDKRNFHIDTYQLTEYSEDALKSTNETEGHFTIKVDPFSNKENLKKYGFYYVDTLTEPICKKEDLTLFESTGGELSESYDKDTVLAIATEAFSTGRFHRDFNIPKFMADNRYTNWVKDLIDKELILGL